MATMTDPTLELLEASARLERAEGDRRVAELRYATLLADAPLRFKVEAIERLRRADVELDATRTAYEAAQDVECDGASTMPEVTFYQRFIAEHVIDTDPRHVEAWMRVAHPTLDGLSRSEFVTAMYVALGQVQDAGPTESEALAASFGL